MIVKGKKVKHGDATGRWLTEEIKRLDALLEYAVMHGDEAEAERLRAALRKLTEEF